MTDRIMPYETRIMFSPEGKGMMIRKSAEYEKFLERQRNGNFSNDFIFHHRLAGTSFLVDYDSGTKLLRVSFHDLSDGKRKLSILPFSGEDIGFFGGAIGEWYWAVAQVTEAVGIVRRSTEVEDGVRKKAEMFISAMNGTRDVLGKFAGGIEVRPTWENSLWSEWMRVEAEMKKWGDEKSKHPGQIEAEGRLVRLLGRR